MFEKNMLNCIIFTGNLNFEIRNRWSNVNYEQCSMFFSCLTWALMVGIMKEMESWLGRQMKWHLNVEPGTFCSSWKCLLNVCFICGVCLVSYLIHSIKKKWFCEVKLISTNKKKSEEKNPYFAKRSKIHHTSHWFCSREKYAMLFDEPIPIHANSWYVAWARISGPSSDCGSTGQSVVTTDDQ